MQILKYLGCLTAALMTCCIAAGCSKQETDPSQPEDTTSAADTANTSGSEESKDAAQPPELEEMVEAKPGEAYLAIVDSKWWIQYWGTISDAEKPTMLSYQAGVAEIKGNGMYTVSVTADTNGFRYETTEDVNDASCIPSGIDFAAVIIKDGETVCPDAAINIRQIRVNGEPIALKAKGYTNNEDGAIRSNIYNKWVDRPGEDARSEEGYLYKDNNTDTPAVADIDDYSPQIIEPENFGSWTTVEVTFEITGMGEEPTTESDDTTATEDATAAEDTAAETTTTATEG